MYQKMTIYGRVGKTPEVFTTQNGNSITKFSVAVTEKRKNPHGELIENTEWFNCIAFKQTGKFIGDYIQKGQLVFIEAVQSTGEYTDKNGNPRKSHDFIVNRVHAEPRQKESNNPGTTI
jgi:single-strand DNA-binding protein